MKQLTGLDALFLYAETAHAPMHICALSIYDQRSTPLGTVRFKGILENLENRLHLARNFRQRLVRVPLSLDHPYWIEDPAFDLEFHVRHIALPKPDDWRQLCIQVARLHARGLDLARPLWEMYVIEGLDNIPGLPEGSYAVLHKTHHAAIDGISAADIIAATHDLAPNAEAPDPTEPWQPEREPGAVGLLARAYVSTLRHPIKFAGLLGRTVPALAQFAPGQRPRHSRRAPRVPRTRFNATVSPHRVFEGRTFDLADVKAIKSTVPGATVNDAILAICGGALRAYLKAHDELPEESLVALTPVSVRTSPQAGSAGNQISAMFVGVGTDIEDPFDRLQAVHTTTAQAKELTHAIGARLMTDYTQFVPSTTAALAARLYCRLGLGNRINPGFNCVITNVPGPQEPLYSGGARLVTTYGLGPIVDGVGLIIAVYSYCGALTIGVTSCRDILPDPGVFADHLEAAFTLLKEATAGRAVPRRRARRAPAKGATSRRLPAGGG